VDSSDSSWLTISWDSPLDNGNPYLSYYELGFDDITFYSEDSEAHSLTFTGLSQSSSHNLTLAAISVFNGHKLKSSQYIIRVKILSKWMILSLAFVKVDP
jgi:hypothetical protein